MQWWDVAVPLLEEVVHETLQTKEDRQFHALLLLYTETDTNFIFHSPLFTILILVFDNITIYHMYFS